MSLLVVDLVVVVGVWAVDLALLGCVGDVVLIGGVGDLLGDVWRDEGGLLQGVSGPWEQYLHVYSPIQTLCVGP